MQDGIQHQFEEALERHEKLRQTLDFVSDNVTKEIHTAVRRSVANLKAQLQASGALGKDGNGGGGISNVGSGVGVDAQELKKMLMSKVDQVDLEAVINMKSNKADTDIAMKGLDIVHKQVTHMIVLVVELIKSCMNSLSIHNDSDKTKHHKNLMYILQ